jgi:hypothetical protein
MHNSEKPWKAILPGLFAMQDFPACGRITLRTAISQQAEERSYGAGAAKNIR